MFTQKRSHFIVIYAIFETVIGASLSIDDSVYDLTQHEAYNSFSEICETNFNQKKK